jgi:ornithine cyclodeaminase
MACLISNRREVEDLLSMEACIAVMDAALEALTRGELTQPLRTIYAPPNAAGLMAWMPAHRSGEHAVFGRKMLCIIPQNPQRGLDGHQGAVVLMDGVTGCLSRSGDHVEASVASTVVFLAPHGGTLY